MIKNVIDKTVDTVREREREREEFYQNYVLLIMHKN